MCYILYYIIGLLNQMKLDIAFFLFLKCFIKIGNVFIFIFPQNNNSMSQEKKPALEYIIRAIWKQELKLMKWPFVFILFFKFCTWIHGILVTSTPAPPQSSLSPLRAHALSFSQPHVVFSFL